MRHSHGSISVPCVWTVTAIIAPGPTEPWGKTMEGGRVRNEGSGASCLRDPSHSAPRKDTSGARKQDRRGSEGPKGVGVDEALGRAWAADLQAVWWFPSSHTSLAFPKRLYSWSFTTLSSTWSLNSVNGSINFQNVLDISRNFQNIPEWVGLHGYKSHRARRRAYGSQLGLTRLLEVSAY